MNSAVRKQGGTSLVEVLVTVVILSLGLLGLARLQSRLQVSQLESYQRSQALILLTDIASRISTNRTNSASYVTGAGAPLGTGMTCPATDNTSTRQQLDAAQWCVALQGAAETTGGGNAGAMIGGRGCVQDLAPGAIDKEYLVTVTWQGQAPVSAPPAGVACGQGLYDNATVGCVNDLCRRAVTTVVRIAALT